MAIAMDKGAYRFFTGSDAEITPVENYDTKLQEIDKISGLPLFKITGELINKIDGSVLAGAKLKLAAKTAQEVAARTEYGFTGDLMAVVYTDQRTNQAAISYKLIGSLVSDNAPAAPKSFPAPNKD
jgi:hypothetical protein